jgi:hypothetical protein
MFYIDPRPANECRLPPVSTKPGKRKLHTRCHRHHHVSAPANIRGGRRERPCLTARTR